MCYWRRLSKRSADNFELEYTANTTSQEGADEAPVVSDSVNLFKALQVRTDRRPEKSARSGRRKMSEVYSMDADEQPLEEGDARAPSALVCYRYTEVMVFMITMATLLLLVVCVAFTCWLRIVKLTKLRRLQLADSSWGRQASFSSGSCAASPMMASPAGSTTSSLTSSATLQQQQQKVAACLWQHHRQLKQLVASRRAPDASAIMSPRPHRLDA